MKHELLWRTGRAWILLTGIVLAVSCPATARQWHVSTTGTENPNGTIAQPWGWMFAMGGADARIQPGDTLYYHGGTYTYPQGFFCDLVGTAARPIVVMPWQNERVVFQVSNSIANSVMSVYGAHTYLIGLEFDCRVTNTSSQMVDGVRFAGPDHGIPNGGLRNRLINCVVHNATNNGIADQDAEGTELYGNIVYYAGRRTSGGNAYAVYGQNHFPTRKLYEHNIFLTTFADYQLHMYGTNTAVDNITLRENVLLNTVSGPRMMFSSALHSCEGIVVEGNLWWGRSAGEIIFQERKGMVAPVYRGNIFARGRLSFRSSSTDRTFEQNFVWGAQPEETTSGAPTVSFNTARHPANEWHIDQATVPLNRVVVFPNRYEPGRGNVVIYNMAQLAAVEVDLSTLVGSGSQYVIRDAQNYLGAPIASGTYGGGTVSIPMTSTTVPPPVTQHPEFPAPTHSGREFGVFVVIGADGGSPPPPPPVDPPPTGTLAAAPDTLPGGGGDVQLTWTSRDASSALLNQGIGTVSLNGSMTRQVTSTTTFILTLSGAGGTATYSRTVVVSDAPVVQVPAPPVILAPGGGAVEAPEATIEWSKPAGASGYQLHLAHDQRFMLRLLDTLLADTSLRVGALRVGANYCARVRALNDAGFSQFSPTLVFSTTSPKTDVAAAEGVPGDFELVQNFPNPFNPSTSIPVRIATTTQVSLRVYNTLGEEVALLVNETLPPGEHRFSFNADGLPTGVYLYRLRAGTFSDTKRMVLVK